VTDQEYLPAKNDQGDNDIPQKNAIRATRQRKSATGKHLNFTISDTSLMRSRHHFGNLFRHLL
jgi:hypothetical protein